MKLAKTGNCETIRIIIESRKGIKKGIKKEIKKAREGRQLTLIRLNATVLGWTSAK